MPSISVTVCPASAPRMETLVVCPDAAIAVDGQPRRLRQDVRDHYGLLHLQIVRRNHRHRCARDLERLRRPCRGDDDGLGRGDIVGKGGCAPNQNRRQLRRRHRPNPACHSRRGLACLHARRGKGIQRIGLRQGLFQPAPLPLASLTQRSAWDDNLVFCLQVAHDGRSPGWVSRSRRRESAARSKIRIAKPPRDDSTSSSRGFPRAYGAPRPAAQRRREAGFLAPGSRLSARLPKA